MTRGWQGSLNGGSTPYQYLYCGSSSSQPHQLTGLYPIGTTCSSKSGAVYTSSDDAWGNVTSRTHSGTTATLSYDLLDHFVQWNAGTNNQEWYIYDGAGNRVFKRTINSTSTTLLVYAFGLEEHKYGQAGANLDNTYYYSLGGRMLGALSSSEGMRFSLTDALGSVLVSFNYVAGSATVKGNQDFGPYGNKPYSQGTINTAKGYTGQYHESLTGLDYYGSRYYDPVAGVFLSADTVQGNLQGANPYAYVGGNPETHTDPTGSRAVPGGCSDLECGNGIGLAIFLSALKYLQVGTPTVPSKPNLPALAYVNPFAVNHTLPSASRGSSPSDSPTSCGTAGPSQPLCGNFGVNFALSLSTGGQIGVPGPWCLWCGSGGGSNNGGESGSGNDLTSVLASDTEGGTLGEAGAANDLGGEPSDAAALEIPWSSKTIRQAAEALDAGDTEVVVANRSEAEELFLRKYQGRGYINTTDLSGPETKDLFGSKYGTYHWDDVFDLEGRIQGHGPDNPHGNLPHLQIQPFADEESQDIIRIFFWPW